MTMLDDDRLATLLARAGAAFEVPATGADDIVARAAGSIPATAGSDGPATAPAVRRRTPETARRSAPSRRGTAGCSGWWPSPAGTASSRSPPASSSHW